MYTSADQLDRIAQQELARAAASAAAAASAGTAPVSTEAAAVAQSGSAEQVEAYVQAHPEEAQAVYEEVLRVDAPLYYQLARNGGSNAAQFNCTSPATGGPDLSAELAQVTGKDEPYEQIQAAQTAVLEIEKKYGADVASRFMAGYIRLHPSEFAQGVTEMSEYLSPAAKAIFASALGEAYETRPCSPTNLESFSGSLIDGTYAGQDGYARTIMSELVASSGNGPLQADFVTAGLNRGKLLIDTDNGMGFSARNGQVLISTMGPATAGSREAAQAVIKFAENNRVGESREELKDAGVESLRWILDSFSHSGVTSSTSYDLQTGYITFLDAALHGSGTPTLTDRQSAELFMAISGAPVEDTTGLLEADGPGGKSDPRGTALTSELFETYFVRWMQSTELGMQQGGQIAENGSTGTPLAGVDINGAFRQFFGEALLDTNEAGAYREGLQQFVMGKVFESMDPNSAFSRAVKPDTAAALAGNLVGMLEGAEVDATRAFRAEAAADERTKERMFTMLVVVTVASGGAWGAASVASTSARVLIAALTEAGKSGGRIAVEELVSRGVDEKTAEMVAGYANGDINLTDAFKGAGLYRELAAAGMDEEKLQAYESWVSGAVGDADFTLGEVITDGLTTLGTDLSPELRQRLLDFKQFFDGGLERQRRENTE